MTCLIKRKKERRRRRKKKATYPAQSAAHWWPRWRWLWGRRNAVWSSPRWVLQRSAACGGIPAGLSLHCYLEIWRKSIKKQLSRTILAKTLNLVWETLVALFKYVHTVYFQSLISGVILLYLSQQTSDPGNAQLKQGEQSPLKITPVRLEAESCAKLCSNFYKIHILLSLNFRCIILSSFLPLHSQVFKCREPRRRYYSTYTYTKQRWKGNTRVWHDAQNKYWRHHNCKFDVNYFMGMYLPNKVSNNKLIKNWYLLGFKLSPFLRKSCFPFN